jgi:hypothetical protein
VMVRTDAVWFFGCAIFSSLRFIIVCLKGVCGVGSRDRMPGSVRCVGAVRR